MESSSNVSMCPKKRNRLIAFAVLAFLVLFILVAPAIPWRTEYQWNCSTCGAKKHMTDHLLWGKSYPVVVNGIRGQQDAPSPATISSPLHEWMKRNGIPHDHDWVQTAGTTYDPFGFPRMRSHASAPPIYHLQELAMTAFLKNATEEDVLDFIRQLSGSTDEANAAVDKVNQSWINNIGTVQPAK